MQKLLILPIIFLSLMMSSVVHAKWTQVDKNVDGDTFYVDLERIKKHSGKIYYWELADYLKPIETGMISNKSYIEAECGRFRFRYLNSTFYEGPMASGTISSSDNTPEKNWRYAPPDSVKEFILKTVCNHKN
jgi:hypothetical protein